MSREIYIYTDESDSVGVRYSNFYGGSLVWSHHLEEVNARLLTKKAELHLHGEIKWSKVTSQYLAKYVAVIDEFFDLVEEQKVKVRLMFTDNHRLPRGLQDHHVENRFHILYYQFIKHAFGFRHLPPATQPTRIRLYLDRLPTSREQNDQFKGYLAGLNRNPGFRAAGLVVRPDQIAEVDSHAHTVLQLTDIVLGSMQFRLNGRHQECPPGARTRGKRTIAKHKLYKHILSRINRVYPRFNPGISTGWGATARNLWEHPYRHWVFVPNDWEPARTDQRDGE